LDNQKINLVDR